MTAGVAEYSAPTKAVGSGEVATSVPIRVVALRHRRVGGRDEGETAVGSEGELDEAGQIPDFVGDRPGELVATEEEMLQLLEISQLSGDDAVEGVVC